VLNPSYKLRDQWMALIAATSHPVPRHGPAPSARGKLPRRTGARRAPAPMVDAPFCERVAVRTSGCGAGGGAWLGGAVAGGAVCVELVAALLNIVAGP